MEKTMFQVFEEIIERYRPSNYNGTIPISSITLGEESALISVETASMASKVTISEVLDEVFFRENVVSSLEKSLRENSEVWDELSKH